MLFKNLRLFSTIVVTGPQRSGTKFVAEIIAEELGLRYVNESEYGVHAFDCFWKLLDEPAVIHAPAMSAYCHLLPGQVAVVFVIRDVAEILASQARIAGWCEIEEPRELAKYFRSPGGESSAALKYDAWTRFQKPALASAGKAFFELHYPADVQDHPRFVRAADRRDWLPQQTRPL
jgi:hypothetical protein